MDIKIAFLFYLPIKSTVSHLAIFQNGCLFIMNDPDILKEIHPHTFSSKSYYSFCLLNYSRFYILWFVVFPFEKANRSRKRSKISSHTFWKIAQSEYRNVIFMFIKKLFLCLYFSWFLVKKISGALYNVKESLLEFKKRRASYCSIVIVNDNSLFLIYVLKCFWSLGIIKAWMKKILSLTS